MYHAGADKGVHTLLAVNGTSQVLVNGIDNDHLCSHRSMGRGVGDCWIRFLFHNSGGKSYIGTTDESKEGNGEELG